jgi:hypothetical protein
MESEVIYAFSVLKNGKASGKDNICGSAQISEY